MPVRKPNHNDNPDWEMIRDEVDEALYVFREFMAGSDAEAPDYVAEVCGKALLALAEHNNIADTYIYGKGK